MSYLAAKQRYVSDATETVSPGRLVTMLYDRLVSDLMTAEDALRRGDIEVTGNRLAHAQEILLELHSTLDTTIWPAGEGLASLYTWMVAELMRARLQNEPQRVADCRELIEPLREAWHQAQEALSQQSAPIAAGRIDGAA
jgi:flagellar protein FliS